MVLTVLFIVLVGAALHHGLKKSVILKDENVLRSLNNYSKRFNCTREDLVARALEEYTYITEHLVQNPNLTMAFVTKDDDHRVHTAYEPPYIVAYRRHMKDPEG